MSTLTDAEREAFDLIHAEWCGDDECGCICRLETRVAAVEAILTTRGAALRAEIAAAIEAERDALQEGGPWDGCPVWSRPESDALTVAARLARGGA